MATNSRYTVTERLEADASPEFSSAVTILISSHSVNLPATMTLASFDEHRTDFEKQLAKPTAALSAWLVTMADITTPVALFWLAGLKAGNALPHAHYQHLDTSRACRRYLRGLTAAADLFGG